MQQKTIDDFLKAAHEMGDAMMVDVQEKDPGLAEKVAQGFACGEDLVIAFVVGQRPAIELMSRSECKSVRTIASIFSQTQRRH